MSSFKSMYGLPSFGTTFIEKKLLLQKTFTKFSGTIGKMILKKKGNGRDLLLVVQVQLKF